MEYRFNQLRLRGGHMLITSLLLSVALASCGDDKPTQVTKTVLPSTVSPKDIADFKSQKGAQVSTTLIEGLWEADNPAKTPFSGFGKIEMVRVLILKDKIITVVRCVGPDHVPNLSNTVGVVSGESQLKVTQDHLEIVNPEVLTLVEGDPRVLECDHPGYGSKENSFELTGGTLTIISTYADSPSNDSKWTEKFTLKKIADIK